MSSGPFASPLIVPLGDRALLVRFGDSLTDEANLSAVWFARRAAAEAIPGVVEVVPGLVSVMLRYEAGASFAQLSREVQMRLGTGDGADAPEKPARTIGIAFDGEDLPEVSALFHIDEAEFVRRHNASQLRVLATGFAPGFVYCGFHPPKLELPRRMAVRPMVPAGTVLFAARQTAIAATPIRTGWHVIGRTVFRNFDPLATVPTKLTAGEAIRFEVAK